MPSITNYHHLSLTVPDLGKSAKWYHEVLGFSVDAEIEGDGFRRTRLRHPDAAITLTLTQHQSASGEPFDERRTGMDHVAFGVPDTADIEAWERHFDELGVVHSGIKPTVRASGSGAMITLRDPDNVQLEVFAPGE